MSSRSVVQTTTGGIDNTAVVTTTIAAWPPAVNSTADASFECRLRLPDVAIEKTATDHRVGR
jgi:hypothetical protein